MSEDLIVESLEQVVEIAGDISPACYEKFFARSPESHALMMHMDDIQRGKMMEEVYRLIMVEDYAAESEYLNWEINNHEIAYSVLPHMYDDFFIAFKETVREAMGAAWSDAFDTAWNIKIDQLLKEIKPRFNS